MRTLIQDVRFGLRTLLNRPGFTVVAVLTLALGIGANTAIFSVVNAVLLRPLPYKDSERLVVTNLSLPDYEDLRRANHSFDGMAVWATNLYNLTVAGGEPEQVSGGIVSPDFFALLGGPALGRTPTPQETDEPLAVISHELWRERFGGEVSALGKVLNLNGKGHTVVGVMPPDFQFPNSRFKVWVTFGSAMNATPQQAQNRALRIFRALGRLKPGVSAAAAQAEADA